MLQEATGKQPWASRRGPEGRTPGQRWRPLRDPGSAARAVTEGGTRLRTKGDGGRLQKTERQQRREGKVCRSESRRGHRRAGTAGAACPLTVQAGPGETGVAPQRTLMDSLPQHRAGRRRDGQRRERSGEGTGRVETRTGRRAGRAAETGLSGAAAKHTPLCTSGRPGRAPPLSPQL